MMQRCLICLACRLFDCVPTEPSAGGVERCTASCAAISVSKTSLFGAWSTRRQTLGGTKEMISPNV